MLILTKTSQNVSIIFPLKEKKNKKKKKKKNNNKKNKQKKNKKKKKTKTKNQILTSFVKVDNEIQIWNARYCF